MQRQEIPNNTPAQVREYVREALAIVEEIAPPGELREAVFAGALNLVSGKQIVMMQPQPMDLSALKLGNRH